MLMWALLIPAVLAFFWMFYRSPSRALVDIYLPFFLTFPLFYIWRIKGVPPFDMAQLMMIAFGVVLLFRHFDEFFFSRADLWIVLFAYCGAISEVLRFGYKAGLFKFAGDLTAIVLPYFVAKLLIEQYNMRAATLRRICWVLFLVALFSIYEFTRAVNPYHANLDVYFKDQGVEWSYVQMRWGMARIAGPFAHTILTGMIFFAAALFNVWLIRTGAWQKDFRWFKLPGRLHKGWIVTGGLFLGLFMTQSRGPWLATPFGFVMTAVGLARSPRRALLQLTFATLLVAAIVYPFAQAYTSGALWQPNDQDRQNAIYRRRLIQNYTPVVQRGGLWGWGTFFPVIAAQNSIDNEYLLILLQRGYVGLALFLLLSLDTFYHLIRTGITSRSRSDAIFTFCLVGIFGGFLFSIATVFLGLQVYTFFFFLAGWAQAIGRPRKGFRPLFSDFHEAQLDVSRNERVAVLQ